MMNCPKCQSNTIIYDSRRREHGTWRRRECVNGHRFSTMEQLYELSADERRAILSKNGQRAAASHKAEKIKRQLTPLKILAYLQNAWFLPGTQQRHVDMYHKDQSFHRRVLAMSATGRALIKAFGRELYDLIIWDNASTEHGATRDHVSPPDPTYMEKRLVEEKPSVVLLFGKQAQRGWEQIGLDLSRAVVVFTAPHPMARGSQVEHLEDIATRVRRIYYI